MEGAEDTIFQVLRNIVFPELNSERYEKKIEVDQQHIMVVNIIGKWAHGFWTLDSTFLLSF